MIIYIIVQQYRMKPSTSQVHFMHSLRFASRSYTAVVPKAEWWILVLIKTKQKPDIFI